jgi:predicted ferric reductase
MTWMRWDLKFPSFFSLSNTAVHNSSRMCSNPIFKQNSPQSWKWLVGPVILYFLERLARMIRSTQEVTISKILKHPSNVLEICFFKDNMSMTEPGQYVLLNVPELSGLQWHPFTLTSAPGDNFLSVHIRGAGDWTKVSR